MKNILGHRSWNKTEVLAILARSHSFTMCNLPHYRYDGVKAICRDLQRQGLIEKSGLTEQGINWRVTAKWYDGSDLV